MKKYLLSFMFLFFLALLSYGNTFDVPFTYDDDNYIVENPTVKSFRYFSQPAAVFSIPELTPTYKSSFNTRTLGYFTFACNYHFNGIDVRGYHIFNLLIHLCNSVLVFFLVLFTLRAAASEGECSKSRKDNTWGILVSVMLAGIFCVHPLATSAVTYISQRFASQVALFYLLAFVSFVGFRTGKTKCSRLTWYGMALFSSVCAMFTKENAFTLPYLLAFYDLTFFRPKGSKILVHIPLLLSSLIIPINILRVQKLMSGMDAVHVLGAADNITPLNYFITQFHVLLHYLKLVLFPIGQRVFYDFPVSDSFLSFPVMLGVITFLISSGSAICLWRLGMKRNNRYFYISSFGIAWFFVTLSIESSFIPNINLLMEYRLYLPLAGLIIAVSPLLLYVSESRRKSVMVAFVIVIAVLACATWRRNRVWKSNISLWQDNVEKSPGSAQAEHFLTVAYARNGRLFEAMTHALRALQLRPDYIEVHINLGLIYANLGYYDKALFQLETARRLSPYYAPISAMIREVRERSMKARETPVKPTAKPNPLPMERVDPMHQSGEFSAEKTGYPSKDQTDGSMDRRQ